LLSGTPYRSASERTTAWGRAGSIFVRTPDPYGRQGQRDFIPSREFLRVASAT